MGLVTPDDGWRVPDELWEELEPLLPPRPRYPLGCHRPRVPDRDAMNAILLVLRTGMQWNALNATGLCSSSAAHRRFQEWTEAGSSRSSGVVGSCALTSCGGSTGSGCRPTGRSPRRRSAARRPGLTPPTGQKGGQALASLRGPGAPGRHRDRRGQPQRPPPPSRHRRLDLTRAADAGRALPGALPRQGLRLPQRARRDRGARLRGARPQPRRGVQSARARARPAQSTLGRRARPRLAQPLPGLLVRWSKKARNHLALLDPACGVVAWRSTLGLDQAG